VTSAALVIRRDDQLACRDWIKKHSKSFYLSSLLLPSRVREASWALYAFCRRADDAVDDQDDNVVALRRIENLRHRLDGVYTGNVGDDAIDRAFAAVVERHSIARALPEELLAGMEMDARGERYEDWPALIRYCFRVASTVGLMMTRVMGAPHGDERAWLHAAELGVAMQLTNIARDVGEDARRGRVYLPRALADEVGLETAQLATLPIATAPLQSAVRELVRRARLYYASADLGVPMLPRDCRLAIASSRRIYAGIADAVEANGFDSVRTRAYVSTAGKLVRVLRALPAVWLSPSTTPPAPDDGELAELVRGVGLPATGALGLAAGERR
jgi:15-cis-phytoene synthase